MLSIPDWLYVMAFGYWLIVASVYLLQVALGDRNG